MIQQKKPKFNLAERWNKRAATYPRYKDDSEGFEDSVIDMILENGVELKGRDILDIGCGTGRYTLRLAKLAGNVTGTDISPDMLKILKEDAEEEGFENVSTLLINWTDYQPDKKWDITFCTITPAVKTTEDFAKMIDSANEHTIYLGWHGRAESSIATDIYKAFGIEPVKLDFTTDFLEWLDENNIEYSHRKLADEWKRNRSFEEMVDKISDEIADYDVNPDTDKIRDMLLPHVKDGHIFYTTRVDLGLIIIDK